MAAELKADIETLRSLFPKNHQRFQVLDLSNGELSCSFTGPDGNEIIMTALLQEEAYPDKPPVWCSDSDKAEIETALTEIAELADKPRPRLILTQVNELIDKLCSQFKLPPPEELEQLAKAIKPPELPPAEDLSKEAKALLYKLERSNVESGKSAHAKHRIMKELRGILKSPDYKSGKYTVELVDGNIFEWYIKVFEVEADSELANDLKNLKETKGQGQGYIQIHAIFKDKEPVVEDNFPHKPPFMRVVKPYIGSQFVNAAGAICMELLTDKVGGWSIAYNMESVIVQVISTMSTSNGRIYADRGTEGYSLAAAQQTFMMKDDDDSVKDLEGGEQGGLERGEQGGRPQLDDIR